MFQGISDGAELIKQSVRVLFAHPRFLAPLLFCWLLYAPLIVYLKFFFPWEEFGTAAVVGIAFGVILLLSFILGLSCLVLLEVIQQIESGQRASVFKAFIDSLRRNFLKALPVLFLWAVLWFILTLIQTLFRRRRSSEADEPFSAENAARTLAGAGGNFSLSAAFFEALKKGLRMIVFLILPAIAWEGRGPFSAIERGLQCLRAHLAEFVAGFVLSELAAIIVFSPPAILFYLDSKLELELADGVWLAVIVYCALAWSFTLYIEQMFAAELYLWHLKWLHACEAQKDKNRPLPKLSDIPRPSILDETPELTAIGKSGG